MKKLPFQASVLVMSFLLVGCTPGTDSGGEKQTPPAEVSVDEKPVSDSSESTPSIEPAVEPVVEKESDEKILAKINALNTIYSEQTTEADALPYLEKIRTLIEKMQEPDITTVLQNTFQVIQADAIVNGPGNIDSHLNWTSAQFEKIMPEKVTLKDSFTINIGIGYILDGIQYLKGGPQMATAFLDKMEEFFEKTVANQKDTVDGPLFPEKLAMFRWMIAWNAILAGDYQKADTVLMSVEKFYRDQQKQFTTETDEDEEALESLANSDMESSPLSGNEFFAHVDFLRAFILYGTDKKEDALKLFRQGIQNDLKYSNGIYSKNLYDQLQAMGTQGHDISGLQIIREELETQLKDSLTKGIEVTSVSDDSPAKKAGIKVGDRITKYDGWYVFDMELFSCQRWVQQVQKMEGTVQITVLSDGEAREMEVPKGRLGVGTNNVE